MWKICTKCGKHKALWAFNRRSDRPFSTSYYCKCCSKKKSRIYYKNNSDKLNKRKMISYFIHREEILKKAKIYRKNNSLLVKAIKKQEYIRNKKNYDKRNKEYYVRAKDEIKKTRIVHYNKNKDIITEKYRKYSHQKAKFEVFADRLTIEESPRLAKDGISLEVKCKYCRQYYIPSNSNVSHRIKALNSKDSYRENNLYCSEECKQACPVYNNHGGIPSTSLREAIPQELRDEVLQSNDGMCEMCGEHPSKEVHHEKPVATHPHLQLDKENLWGLCNYCHYEVCHQMEGCTLPELRENSCKRR